MSRHEGVSCDACLKSNFRGRRFKCLICYDYDLCAACFESGVVTSHHAAEHAMQCILTRSDFELYYSGEALGSDQPQALTCPFCGRMGHTEASLQEHVAAEHAETPAEVICPICASLPGGDPNLVTDDFAGHLTLEHRSGPRDLISFLDEPSATRHGMRRIPHPSGRGGARARRSNMHFSSSGGLSPSARDSVDPIAELLSQLSGVRRTTGQNSTLQQLQLQLQLERQQVRVARQQLERLPRRQNPAAVPGCAVAVPASAPVQDTPTQSLPQPQSQFLLSRCTEESRSEGEQQDWESERADRSLFVQELFLSMLAGMEALGSPGGPGEPLRPSQPSSNPGPCHQSWTQSSDEIVAASPSASAAALAPSRGNGGSGAGNASTSSSASAVGNKRPARQLPTPQTAGPRPNPHQGSGASVRAATGPVPIRPLFGLRPAARKPARPVNGRNQATEPPPPPH